MLVYGSDFLVVKAPSQDAVKEAIARVANVADAIRVCLRAEYPRFGVQRLFGCFLLEPPGDTRWRLAPNPEGLASEEARVTDVRLLCRYTQRSVQEEERCVAQYRRWFPLAMKTKRELGLSDRDTWAKLVLEQGARAAELKRLLLMMLGFLLTETECERNFALEKRANEARPRSHVATRHQCLKIILDGLPCERIIVCNAEVVGDFWRRVQNKYAELYGTRQLGDVKQRKDAKVDSAGPAAQTEGHRLDRARPCNTTTGFKRRRAMIVTGEVDPAAGTVFGHARVDQVEVDTLRRHLQEEQACFKHIHEKAKRKYDEQFQQLRQLAKRRPGALRPSELTAAKRDKVGKKEQKKRATLSRIAFRGIRRLTVRRCIRTLGGQPVVFASDPNCLGPGGLDEPFGDRQMRDVVFQGSLPDFVMAHGAAHRRHIILVPDIACVSRAVRAAAVCLGARVQEDVLRPAVQYHRLLGHTIAFTAAFTTSNREVVKVFRAAARRFHAPSVKIVSMQVLVDSLPARGAGNVRNRTILYSTMRDPELSRADAALSVARSFEEFMTKLASIEK